MDEDLSADERRAIAALRRLARRWPQTLTLIAGTGPLAVVLTDDYASGRVLGSGGETIVASIDGIPNDGGDPW